MTIEHHSESCGLHERQRVRAQRPAGPYPPGLRGSTLAPSLTLLSGGAALIGRMKGRATKAPVLVIWGRLGALPPPCPAPVPSAALIRGGSSTGEQRTVAALVAGSTPARPSRLGAQEPARVRNRECRASTRDGLLPVLKARACAPIPHAMRGGLVPRPGSYPGLRAFDSHPRYHFAAARPGRVPGALGDIPSCRARLPHPSPIREVSSCAARAGRRFARARAATLILAGAIAANAPYLATIAPRPGHSSSETQKGA